MQEDPFTAESFVLFIKNHLAHHAREEVKGEQETLILFDNAAQHRATFTQDTFKELHLKALTIPPYCPQLNPAEKVINMIKHKAKAIKVRREPFDERTISMIASEIGKRHCSKFFKESEES